MSRSRSILALLLLGSIAGLGATCGRQEFPGYTVVTLANGPDLEDRVRAAVRLAKPGTIIEMPAAMAHTEAPTLLVVRKDGGLFTERAEHQPELITAGVAEFDVAFGKRGRRGRRRAHGDRHVDDRRRRRGHRRRWQRPHQNRFRPATTAVRIREPQTRQGSP